MNTPKIRFKGFKDDWEQRKLGEIVLRESLARESTIDLPYVEYEDVIAEEGRINKDIRKKEGIKKGIFFDGSQVLYGKLRPYLHNWLNPDFSGVAVGDWWVLKPNNVDKNFIYRLIQTQQFDDIANQSTGSKMPRADWNLVSNTEFAIPTSQVEQTKIGGYFFTLDNLITLHQRKCDETKQLKKFMLQKMFPKNGEKNPEIRFEGFTDDWEQRKFSELYAKSSEKNDGSIGMDKNITVATMQFKEDVKVSTAEYLKTYYTFNFGDIAFEGHQSKEFRYGRFVENDIGNGIVSHIFAVFRPIREYDLHFWKYAINNEALMQRILSRSTKASTMMHDLVTNDFLNETFLVPSLDEQRRIGAFLDTLDNLITLHQRKCEKLKELKKYMLQNMFV